MAHLKDKVSEKVQEAIFNQYMTREGNNECADCGNRSPTWVSLDFGVFVCIRCSGVHRQLGPHITRVRSTRLDAWQKGNIEIMGAVGNKLANDFYENRMPTGYRKPGPNSTPEECRRFVDEKYIKKTFSPSGYQEPVKEFLAARERGEKPNYGFTQEPQNEQKVEVKQEKQYVEHVNGDNNNKYQRKKSMSLDKLPSEGHGKHGDKKAHQYADLLSADDDLLGGGNHPHTDNDFGDFKEAHQTHSASPVKKINFANFKKANNSTPPSQDTKQDQQNHWAWDMSGIQQNGNTTQNANGNQNSTQNQQQQQPQNDSKVDVMKLYSQPTNHQNHFMNGGHLHHGGWHSHGGWGTGNNFQMGNMQQQQNFYQQGGMGFQNNYGGQQFNMGQNQVNYNNMNMGGQNMMYGQNGFGQQNVGFVQANKFY